MGESHGIRRSLVKNFTGNLATMFTIFAPLAAGGGGCTGPEISK